MHQRPCSATIFAVFQFTCQNTSHAHAHTQSLTAYTGWSDVTALWSQHDLHFVGQHIILCAVKWRFVALFK